MEMKVEMEIFLSFTLFMDDVAPCSVLYLNLRHTMNECVCVFLVRLLAYARHIIVICILLLAADCRCLDLRHGKTQ